MFRALAHHAGAAPKARFSVRLGNHRPPPKPGAPLRTLRPGDLREMHPHIQDRAVKDHAAQRVPGLRGRVAPLPNEFLPVPPTLARRSRWGATVPVRLTSWWLARKHTLALVAHWKVSVCSPVGLRRMQSRAPDQRARRLDSAGGDVVGARPNLRPVATRHTPRLCQGYPTATNPAPVSKACGCRTWRSDMMGSYPPAGRRPSCWVRRNQLSSMCVAGAARFGSGGVRREWVPNVFSSLWKRCHYFIGTNRQTRPMPTKIPRPGSLHNR